VYKRQQKIHFEFDRSTIRPISYPILDDVADLLMRNPQIHHVRIEGHTDWIGSDAYNMGLSQRRADSVRTYLINKGIDPSRLIAVGYGETRPIADNNTVLGRAKNRRVEFTVLD
jgi:outer membrane protein OmpA-like peptidoglycan-associated protein